MFCERCGGFNFSDTMCHCVLYKVYLEENFEELFKWEDYYCHWALRPEDAAESFAISWNEHDNDLMNESMKIRVIAPDGESSFYSVGAEPSVEYFVKEL